MSALDRFAPGRVRARSDPSPRHAVGGPLSMLAFWTAIVLPALYLPLLAAGIDTPGGLTLFVGLFGLHVLALVGGRGYAES